MVENLLRLYSHEFISKFLYVKLQEKCRGVERRVYVLVWPAIDFVFFIVSCTVLCFAFVIKIVRG